MIDSGDIENSMVSPIADDNLEMEDEPVAVHELLEPWPEFNRRDVPFLLKRQAN